MSDQASPLVKDERAALDLEPQPLAEHAGDARYLNALAEDRSYRAAILVGLFSAMVASTAFGGFSMTGSKYQPGLWILVVATVFDYALPRTQAMARQGPWLAVTGATTTCFLIIVLRELWIPENTHQVDWELWAPCLLVICVVLLRRVVSPTNGLKQLGVGIFAVAAALAILWQTETTVMQKVGCVAPMVGLFALVLISSTRPGVETAIVSVCILHIGGLIAAASDEPTVVWVHVGFSAANAVALSYAGYRDAMAHLHALPMATYRRAPLCVVPRLDRSRDFPVKIDAT